MNDTNVPKGAPVGYSIAVAEGPDGCMWLRAEDITNYLTDVASYLEGQNARNDGERYLETVAYLRAISGSLSSAHVSPTAQEEAV